MSEWQDIETAPKNGDSFLAWVPDDLLAKPWFYSIVRWHNGSWIREGDDFDLVVEPTLWQALPTPPTVAEGE